MDDWWLCQAAGRVGLVPANYLLEVQPIPAVLAEDSIDGVEEHIYDHIPAEKNDILERRHSDNLSPFHRKEGEGLYDVPRRNLSSSALGLNAITLVGNRSQSPTLQDPLYDRPRAYSSDQTEPLYDYPKSNAPIYQVPPTTLLQNGIYDVPRSNAPSRSLDDGYSSPKRESVLPLSIDMMTVEDAGRRMNQLNEEMNRSWEELVESVYNARWDGTFRELTAARTVAATQSFDAHLNAFQEFVKGCINVLSQTKEDAPRRKFSDHFSKLHESRVDFLDKLGFIQDGSGDIQSSAQSLISHGLSMLQTIRELDILIRAFRSLIFKKSATENENSRSAGYASASLDVRHLRRRPTDALPPTPDSTTSEHDMQKNLEKVKNFSKIITTPQGLSNLKSNDNRLKHQSESWGSQENLLTTSPTHGIYVSPPSGINPYSPFSSSSPASPVSDTDSSCLTPTDVQTVQSYTREFVSNLPKLIRSVQKLRGCVEATKSQALKRSSRGSEGEDQTRSQIVSASGDVIQVGHCIVIQADAVFKKIENEAARHAVTTASNGISISLRQLGEDSKAAILQYPNLAAIDRVGDGVENVRTSTVALGKLLKELTISAH